MKKLIVLFLTIFSLNMTFGQRYFTKTGIISFDASSAAVSVVGTNKQVVSIFDINTGQFEFSSNIRDYHFKQSLMEEHFNENYMESDKYQKSTFKGFITNIKSVNFNKDGTYNVNVKGIIEIHGVKKNMETTGTFKVSNGIVYGSSNFNVALEDFGVSIPTVVVEAISSIANIEVSCSYTLLNK